MNQQKKTDLEILVDDESLEAVLEALAEIATEKAGHILSSYDDRYLAQAWERVGNRLAAWTCRYTNLPNIAGIRKP